MSSKFVPIRPKPLQATTLTATALRPLILPVANSAKVSKKSVKKTRKTNATTLATMPTNASKKQKQTPSTKSVPTAKVLSKDIQKSDLVGLPVSPVSPGLESSWLASSPPSSTSTITVDQILEASKMKDFYLFTPPPEEISEQESKFNATSDPSVLSIESFVPIEEPIKIDFDEFLDFAVTIDTM